MNKTMKNVISGFTLVCILVLLIFVIALIAVNRNGRNTDSGGPATTNSPPSGNTNTTRPPASGSPSNTPGASSKPSPNTEKPKETPKAPTGKKYETLISVAPQEQWLVFYADEELFEHEELHDAEILRYKGDGAAALEIIPALSILQGVEKTAAKYLDGYLDGKESFPGGLGPVKNSSLYGAYVSGVNGKTTYEAWICSVLENDKDLGIAFVIYYNNKEQKDALYAILDTLEIRKV